jgi:hypothetical protein
VAGECLGHFWREAGTLEARDEQVPVTVEVGEQAAIVLVFEEIGLLRASFSAVGLGLFDPLLSGAL